MKLIPNNLDNCVLTNAAERNLDPNDQDALRYLQGLRSLDQQTVSQYFSRSTKIINKIRELGVDSNSTWEDVYLSHVKSIITQVQQQNFGAVVPAIYQMLSSLESKYGVVYNG